MSNPIVVDKSAPAIDSATLIQASAQAATQAASQATPARDIGMIGHVEVSMAAQVGTVTMSVERLFALAAGDIVKMNELLEAPLTLMLNGKPVARGELLAVDDHFGIRILDVA